MRLILPFVGCNNVYFKQLFEGQGSAVGSMRLVEGVSRKNRQRAKYPLTY